jgi:hypothetical protein
MMIGLLETCSVWKYNNKYGLFQTEYLVLFMYVYIHSGMDSVILLWLLLLPTLLVLFKF